MKGTLQYVSKDETLVKSWVVWYNEQPDGGNITFVDSLPLHPDDVNEINAWEQIFDNIEARIAANQEVDFKFYEIWEQVEGETKVTKYAKLISKDKETTCEYSGLPSVTSYDSVKYPELEGTMNLCNDIISNREISDEEIEKAINEYANVYQCPSEVKMCKHDIISAWNNAIKWYREQLKKKQ